MTVGSLFSGIGGIDLAFEQAGFKVTWANEFDKDACKTYRHNFPDTELYECDIRQLDFNTLGKVDIIAAGFPCQPFSVCGKQEGFKDNRGNLFFEIMRAVDCIHPDIIFLENVANLTEHDKGKTFNVIHNELTEREYYIRYLIADACDYGVPQHRTRTYIIAFRDFEKCNGYKFPEKTKLKAHIFDIIDKTKPAPPEYYLSENSTQYARMDKAIRDADQIYRFSDYGIQSSKDGISFTLKANMGTWHDRVPIIRDDYGIRTVTPEECLALMGFSSTFDFPDIPMKSKYKQCGNSVIVPLVRDILRALS